MKKILLILVIIPFFGFGQTDSIKEYHENGRLKQIGVVKDSLIEGLFKSYYENGQLSLKENSINNKVILQKCWDEDGNKIECEE